MKKLSTIILAFAATTLSLSTFAHTNNQTQIKGYYWTIEPQFDDARYFSDGMAIVKQNDKCGYIDITGKIVIEPQFDAAGAFFEGLARVQQNGECGYIDKTGKIVIEPQFDEAWRFSDGMAAINQNNKWGYIDKTGKIVIKPQFDFAWIFFDEMALIKQNDKWGYIDKTGKIVIESHFDDMGDFSDGMASVKQNNKWGYIDKTGKIMIEPQFDDAWIFVDGMAAIKQTGKCGYIDKTGKLIIEPQFDDAGYFSDGIARIRQNGKWGFIDKTGKMVIEPQFDDARDFSDGMAQVKQNGKYGYIALLISAESYVKDKVLPQINAWQIKGEFETTAMWKERVNEASRKKMAAELSKKYQAKYYSLISESQEDLFKQSSFELMSYDADNQTYLIRSQTQGDILLPVPLEQAPSFKENWAKIKRNVNPTFTPSGDDVVLSAISFAHNGKTYTYDSHTQAKYAVTNIDYNFDPIEIITTPTAIASVGISTSTTPIEQRTLTAGAVKSDISQNIPSTGIKNDKTFVLIIANEDYQKEAPIKTAKNDAQTTKEYCTKTLGIPESNIRYNVNCTWKNMESVIENFAYTMTVNPGCKFLVFYFGHGMADPNPETEDSYMLPIDGSSIQIARDGYSRNRMLGELSKGKPQQCMVFLESCFSGVTPTGEMLAYAKNTSGVRIEQKWSPIVGNIVVFSASSAAQTANAHPSEGHNIFTYELLKAIKESAGDMTLGELYERVSLHTAQSANNLLNAKQTPTFQASFDLADGWKNWKLTK